MAKIEAISVLIGVLMGFLPSLLSGLCDISGSDRRDDGSILSRVPGTRPWRNVLPYPGMQRRCTDMSKTREELMRAFFFGFLLVATGPALAAEKYVGGNVDVRTTLALKALDAGVRKFLPAGWDLDVANSGPAKDVNLRLTFIDRLTAQDAEGKALDPARVITLGVPAKRTSSETRGTMLFRIYSSTAAGVPGPYGVSVQANTNMERRVGIDPAGTATVEESWELQSQDGDSIQLQIQYRILTVDQTFRTSTSK